MNPTRISPHALDRPATTPRRRRRGLALALTALLLAPLSAPVCTVALDFLGHRPGSAHADTQTYGNLIQDGMKDLVEAERRTIAGDRDAAKVRAQRAESRFLEATRVDDRNPVAHRLGCIAASFAMDPEGALKWWRQYRERTPYGRTDPDLPYLRAILLFYGAGRPAEATKSLLRMRALNARHRPVERDTLLYAARMDHGGKLLRRELYTHAVREYREASRVAARNGWARKDIAAAGLVGITLRVSTRWKEAEEVFRLLLTRNPENVLWPWNMGLVVASQNRWDEALPYYDTVIEMRAKKQVPVNQVRDVDLVFLRRGNCYRNLALASGPGEVRETWLTKAERDLKTYIKLYPKDPRGHRWLGEVFYPDRDDPHGALKHYQAAFTLDPDCEVPLRYLVQIYTRYEPKPGATAAETASLQAAWTKQRDTLAKELETGRERREKAIKAREDGSISGVSGCE